MVSTPDKEIPWCTIFLVTGCLVCHSLVLTGNIATSKAMKSLGDSTGGWSDVGVSLSTALTDELDVLMDNVTQVLTVSINNVQKVSDSIDQVLNLTGYVTDNVSMKYNGLQQLNAPAGNIVHLKPAISAGVVPAMSPNLAKVPIDLALKGRDAAPLDATSISKGINNDLLEEEIINMMQAPGVAVSTHQKAKRHTVPRPVHQEAMHHTGHSVSPVLFDEAAMHGLSQGVWTHACRSMHMQNLQSQSSDKVSLALFTQTPFHLPNTTEGVQEFKKHLKASVHKMVAKMMGIVTDLLDKFFVLIEPALIQIGKWLDSFGDKVQAMLESFSTSMDRVQKLFDQLMSKFSSSAGTGEEQMNYDTFTLFDASQTGYISAQDLKDVADMYGIVALQGGKSDGLFAKYDANHDGKLCKAEFALFVADESIPGSMTVVLRTYAKKLSTIAGNVGAARLRDEVAEAVASYLTLVSAKNMTKVGWVSDALTNGSLPMAFTADVLKQLAMNIDNPNVLTTVDVGAIIVGEMMRLNAPYVKDCFDLMSDPAFWASEGFDPNDQPICVERVARWIADAPSATPGQLASILGVSPPVHDGSISQQKDDLVLAARTRVEQRMTLYQQKNHQMRAAHGSKTAVSFAAKHLQTHLLGGMSASFASADPAQAQALNKGKPAKPETLLFAARLSSNASATADTFQKQCFDYSSESSSTLDNFANQVQSMIKKTQNFLRMMQEYSSPVGIKRLEDTIKDFAAKGTDEVSKVLDQYVDHTIDSALPSSAISAPSAPSAPPAPTGLDGIFGEVQSLLATFQSMLPGVVDDMKFARKEVSAVSSTLKSIFSTFKVKGPPIFELVSKLYKTLWVVYFVFFALLTSSVLLYGFWASGYMGGPSAAVVEQYEGPVTWRDRCRVCWGSCNACMKGCHDSNLCFWSVVLLLEVIVLVLFVVAIVLCLLAGIKAFISAGCGQIYLLGDEKICTGTLGSIRNFVISFWEDSGILLGDACNQKTLLTCQLIGAKLKKSAVMTTLGSLIAAVFSFQLIIESAILHERARWRRIFDEDSKEV
mmetsp:Transcript_99917/g.213941  ORF Transcript_99917/g.213941 Transcript_99917/m.213941 type:complete len:1049 (-) Transcript_99917:131-3277(-)